MDDASVIAAGIAWDAEAAVNDALTDPGPVMDHWKTLDVHIRAQYRVRWRQRIREVVARDPRILAAQAVIEAARYERKAACGCSPGYVCRLCEAFAAYDRLLDVSEPGEKKA